jgi:anti-anti-sigma factor
MIPLPNEPLPSSRSRLLRLGARTAERPLRPLPKVERGCSIGHELGDRAAAITVRGSLDSESAPRLLALLNQMQWSDTNGHFVIDLRDVTDVGDDAVTALSTAWRAITAKSGYLVLRCAKGVVADRLAGTELDAAVQIVKPTTSTSNTISLKFAR